jgi:hypothetical protein
MADTLVERLREVATYLKAQTWSEVVPDMGATVDEAVAHIGLLTRSLEMMCKQSSNTSAQGDGSGE